MWRFSEKGKLRNVTIRIRDDELNELIDKFMVETKGRITGNTLAINALKLYLNTAVWKDEG